jgi:hypothetical protein
MNRTIEANFFPPDVEPIKEKACILIIDNNRDFTHSAKLALEKTGRYFVGEENDARKAHQTAQGFKPPARYRDAGNRRWRRRRSDSIRSGFAQDTDCLSGGSCDESGRKGGPADPGTSFLGQTDQSLSVDRRHRRKSARACGVLIS